MALLAAELAEHTFLEEVSCILSTAATIATAESTASPAASAVAASLAAKISTASTTALGDHVGR